MKTDLEVLDQAIALVEADGGWCQGAWCKDVHGVPLEGTIGRGMSPGAKSFCLEGAIRQAAGWFEVIDMDDPIQKKEADKVYLQCRHLDDLITNVARGDKPRRIIGHRYVDTLALFNDDLNTTQEDAVLALKKARERIETGRAWWAWKP